MTENSKDADGRASARRPRKAKKIGVSRKEASSHFGVTPQAITAWDKRGWLVLHSDRSVDLDATAVRVDSERSRTNGGKHDRGLSAVAEVLGDELPAGVAEGLEDGLTLAEARLKHERYKAEKVRLETERMAGKLVDSEEAQREYVGSIIAARKALESIPARLASQMVGLETSHEARVMLTDAIEDALRTLKTEETDDE
jgi:phage terminase Nu1 subunit (DNA packaging protein)